MKNWKETTRDVKAFQLDAFHVIMQMCLKAIETFIAWNIGNSLKTSSLNFHQNWFKSNKSLSSFLNSLNLSNCNLFLQQTRLLSHSALLTAKFQFEDAPL